MEVERERVVAQAQEFMEENEELLDDPMVEAWILEELISQGAQLAVVFGQETEDRVYATADNLQGMELARRSRKVSARQLHRMNQEHQPMVAEAEAYRDSFREFVAFLDRVRLRYYELAGIEDPEAHMREIERKARKLGPL